MKQLKLLFNMSKNPNVSEQHRTVSMTNERYRRIRDFNEYFLNFLENIGFSKISGGDDPNSNDVKFRFQHEAAPMPPL